MFLCCKGFGCGWVSSLSVFLCCCGWVSSLSLCSYAAKALVVGGLVLSLCSYVVVGGLVLSLCSYAAKALVVGGLVLSLSVLMLQRL